MNLSLAEYTVSSLHNFLQSSSELTTTEATNMISKFTIILLVLGTLSALGCIFNIIITFLLKLHRNVLGKMILFLAVNDILFTTSLVGPSLGFESLILVFNIIFGFSWAGSVAWVCCFAHALYASVNFGEDYLNSSLMKKYLIRSLTISILSGILLAIFVAPKHEFDAPTVVFAFLGVLALGSTLYCGFCYVSVLKKLRKYGMKVHLELLLYPLILIVCDFPTVLLQFYFIFISKNFSTASFEISVVCLMSRGIWNSLAYGLSSKIRDGFKSLCRRKPPEGHEEKLLKIPLSNTAQMDPTGDSSSRNTLNPPNFVLDSDNDL